MLCTFSVNSSHALVTYTAMYAHAFAFTKGSARIAELRNSLLIKSPDFLIPFRRAVSNDGFSHIVPFGLLHPKLNPVESGAKGGHLLCSRTAVAEVIKDKCMFCVSVAVSC